MTYSKETLEATLNTLTEQEALRWIGQAGGKRNLDQLIHGLARNFNAVIPTKALEAINMASRRWTAVNRNQQINYKVI